MVRPDGGEQLARLVGTRFGGPALPGRVPDPADRLEGIEDHGMAGDERVEEMTQSRQSLVLGGSAARQLVDEAASQTWAHLVEFERLILAPGEEPTHVTSVGSPGMRIRKARLKELVRGKARGGAGAREDRRKFRPGLRALQRLWSGKGEARIAHHRALMIFNGA